MGFSFGGACDHEGLLQLLTCAVASGLALWLTPRVREAAIRFGIVDRPDGQLKGHKEPVAYLGGLAIYLAFLLALALTVRFQPGNAGTAPRGIDRRPHRPGGRSGILKPWTKLAGQTVAVLVLVKSGIYIKLTFLPGPWRSRCRSCGCSRAPTRST